MPETLSSESYAEHIPVLRDPFVDALVVNPDGCYVDCTFGRGGHSRAILARLSAKGRLLALDRDADAVAAGSALAEEDCRFTIKHADFASLQLQLEEQGWPHVDGVGFDLGLSSPQVDQAERGFSFQKDGPLDMRMDCDHGKPLSELLLSVSEQQLADILRAYGDERYARRIAKAILKSLHDGTLKRTLDLENICFHAVPKQARYGGSHPATRTFQALRIWVNGEMEQIDGAITAAMTALKPSGRLAVISFHSGEDRRIRDMIETAVHPCTCPPQFPMCVCGKKPTMRWVQKKPLRAREEELLHNPRSRSALLRVAERLTLEEGEQLAGYCGDCGE